MSDVIVTTKGKRVLEFLCSKTLIFQIPLYFKLGVLVLGIGIVNSILKVLVLGIGIVKSLLKVLVEVLGQK